MKINKKPEVEQLYKDAYISHLVREGFSDFRAKVEANRKFLTKKL